MLNRRNFIGTSALAVAGVSTLTLEGCSFGSVMANLGKYLPIGLSALAGVANLIAPGAGTAVAAFIGVVQAAWGGLQAAVNEYNSAPAASKATALEKVLLALDLVQEYLAKTSAAIGIGGNIFVKAAVAALALIATTLGAIEEQLAPKTSPATASLHAAHASAHSVASVSVTGTPIAITGKASDFKSAYNKIVTDAGRPDLQLH